SDLQAGNVRRQIEKRIATQAAYILSCTFDPRSLALLLVGLAQASASRDRCSARALCDVSPRSGPPVCFSDGEPRVPWPAEQCDRGSDVRSRRVLGNAQRQSVRRRQSRVTRRDSIGSRNECPIPATVSRRAWNAAFRSLLRL